MIVFVGVFSGADVLPLWMCFNALLFLIVYVVFLSHSAKAIDKYAKLKTKAAEMNDKSPVIDPRMEAIVERMLDTYV